MVMLTIYGVSKFQSTVHGSWIWGKQFMLYAVDMQEKPPWIEGTEKSGKNGK
jgi:hypothetical protein